MPLVVEQTIAYMKENKGEIMGYVLKLTWQISLMNLKIFLLFTISVGFLSLHLCCMCRHAYTNVPGERAYYRRWRN